MLASIALAFGLALAGQQLAGDKTPLPKSEAHKAEEAVKPLPNVAIPDAPPPHEGALIDIPYTIDAPDIIAVEILEALPGRPITGERLVKQDGKISLGFYGDVHVRGLTAEQAKVKIIHHLREYLNDDILGLTRTEVGEEGAIGALPKPGTRTPNIVPIEPPDEVPAPPGPDGKPAAPGKPPRSPFELDPLRPPSASRAQPRMTLTRMSQKTAQDAATPAEVPAGHKIESFTVAIDPVESLRVFVDVTSFNSKVYYVAGDVGTPGRLPVTGQETVLDALNYAGNLIPSAEPEDIHLYRPAQGGKPARDYKINLAAIRKGDNRANLQVFAGDRLVVGRNATVQKTVELDRASAPINAVLNTILQQSFTSRSLGAAAETMNGTTQAQREEAVRRWADFLWDVSSKESGAMLDQKAFRDAVMKRFAPQPEPKK